MAATPYYHLVPKEPRANARFRRDLIQTGLSDPKAALEIWMMCARDILFWINFGLVLYEPRDRAYIPFVTYKTLQDDAILEVAGCIGKWDTCTLKSRDVGGTWLHLAVIGHNIQFVPNSRFLLVSRKEELVDAPGDPDSLFWKLDTLIKYQPSFIRPLIRPGIDRKSMHLEIPETGAVVDGSSTTAATGVGGRYTGLLLDEFSRNENGYEVLRGTSDTTRNRMFLFTPLGANNASHSVAINSNIKQIRMHWKNHPIKNRGMYTSEKVNGQYVLKRLDAFSGYVEHLVNGEEVKIKFPEEYPFVLNGMLRSPAWDFEWRRNGEDYRHMAENWDMDFLASAYQFFDSQVIADRMADTAQEAFYTGDLEFNSQTLEPIEFIERPDGPLKLWFHPVCGKPPRDDRYMQAADIAAGLGASNSVSSIGSEKHGSKVAEYATNGMLPEEFGRLLIALGRWFKGSDDLPAHTVFEANGAPGGTVCKSLMDNEYPNLYMRTDELKYSKKQMNQPGWWSSKESKVILLSQYRMALKEKTYLERSREALRQSLAYVKLPDGRIVHSESVSSEDPTDLDANHGDHTISAALLNMIMKKRIQEVQKAAPIILRGTPAWRRLQWERAQKPNNFWTGT